jgi:hypothetical protein
VGPIHEGHSLLDDGHVLAATTKIFDEMRTLLGPTGAMR